MFLKQTVVHLGVREYSVICVTLFLNDTGFQDTLGDNLAGLTFLPSDQFNRVYGMQP